MFGGGCYYWRKNVELKNWQIGLRLEGTFCRLFFYLSIWCSFSLKIFSSKMKYPALRSGSWQHNSKKQVTAHLYIKALWFIEICNFMFENDNALAYFITFWHDLSLNLLGPFFKSKPQGLINYGGACYKI